MIAREIVDDLTAALAEFEAVALALEEAGAAPSSVTMEGCDRRPSADGSRIPRDLGSRTTGARVKIGV